MVPLRTLFRPSLRYESISAGDLLTEAVATFLSPAPGGEQPLRRVLVALSGGADSVALLLTLHRLRDRVPNLEIKAAHCNFGLRGDESDGDEAFCRELCSRLGIELDVARFDTEDYRRRHRFSVEEACRELRYDRFRRLMAEEGWQRTAVAHHAADNAETFLLNLMRGAGLNGLRGMDPDNGSVIRPFLNIERSRILEALEEWKADYRVDSSNLSSDYRRNFLRNELIPLLETRFPEARRAIGRSIANLRDENDLLLDLAERQLDFKPGAKRLSRACLLPLDHPLPLILRLTAPFGGSPEIAAEIAGCVERGAESGRVWRLGDGWRASLERDFIEILPTDIPPLVVYEERLSVSPALLDRIRTDRDPTVAYFPRPLGEYVLRAPREGERFRGFGSKGTTLVSKLLKEARLTRAEKERLRMLCDPATDTPLWIPGVKRGEGARITPDMAEIWKFSLSPLTMADGSQPGL